MATRVKRAKSQMDIDAQMRRIERLAEATRQERFYNTNEPGKRGTYYTGQGDIPRRNMDRLNRAYVAANRYKSNMQNSRKGKELQRAYDDAHRELNSAYSRASSKNYSWRNMPKYYKEAQEKNADAYWATQQHKYPIRTYMGKVGG